MSLMSVILVFMMVWWIVFFMVLPIGAGKGKPNIKKKTLITTLVTVLASFVFWGVVYFI